MDHDKSEITTLLQRYRQGDQGAAEELWPKVYQELKRLAASVMQRERTGHTLQPTALVHEAYMRLFGSAPVDWQSRSHFFAVAARQMRRLLVDHARRLRSEKRGGGGVKIALEQTDNAAFRRDEDLVAVDEALGRLEELDPRAAQVVELRFFGGLTEDETCEVLRIGKSTMKRDWEAARSFLFQQLGPRKREHDS